MNTNCRYYDKYGRTKDEEDDLGADDLEAMFEEAFADMLGMLSLEVRLTV